MSLGLLVIAVLFMCVWPICWSGDGNNCNTNCRQQLVQLAKRYMCVKSSLPLSERQGGSSAPLN